jgi:mRNA-degrading endonuclease RelE of RelBE toxin-antitoxin system
MRLVFSREATRGLRAVPRKTAVAMVAALERIAADPFARHRNVERLKGVKDGFRLRHGAVRAVYRIERATETMHVERIAPRGEVYR